MKKAVYAALTLFPICLAACAYVSLTPGFFYTIDLRKADSIVFVMDVSGSMQDQTGTKVEQRVLGKAEHKVASALGGGLVGDLVAEKLAERRKKINEAKREVISCVKGLKPTSKFDLIYFRDTAVLWKPKLVRATPENIKELESFIDSIDATGSTNMLEAIEKAFKLNPSVIIVVSDGRPTTSTPEQIINKVRQLNANHKVIIHTVGIGDDHDRIFMARLATENGGIYIPR